MTIQKLTEIINCADNGEIRKQLQQLGYVDCRTDKSELGNVDISALFSGDMQHTKTNGTHLGAIVTNVDGYENCEFIVIVDRNKNMLIYGKQ
ncbi:MAG: hypothetical protein NC131_01220 [Roseburia sp.]|nr:hypothetical protein [Roseburia sp.]